MTSRPSFAFLWARSVDAKQVADAADVEHDPVRGPRDGNSCQAGDHAPTAFSSGGASAWQMPTASASAAWSGVGGDVEAEDRLHHALHLGLLGPAVAAHGLLDPRRRVLSALDSGQGGCDEDGPSRLADGERGAGVDADEGFLERDGIGRRLIDERGDGLEDRLQARLGAVGRGGLPPPVVERPYPPSAFLDDAVPACSRARIDAENLHGSRLGAGSDVPASKNRFALLSRRTGMG